MNELHCIPVSEWLARMRTEYLAEYIPAGGSAVKFVSGSDAVLMEVQRELPALCEEMGYLTVHLDPGQPGPTGRPIALHNIDQLYLAITSGVDWVAWADEMARATVRQMGLEVPEGAGIADVDALAAANGRSADLLVQEYRAAAHRLIQNRVLTFEFRAALTALLTSRLLPDGGTPATHELLTAWLEGRSLPGGAAALKKLMIYGRINKQNARHYLSSFCRWFHDLGRPGICVTLDFRPYERTRKSRIQLKAEREAELRQLVAARAGHDEIQALIDSPQPAAEGIFYSAGAYMNMLSELRSLIDEIEAFPGLVLTVLATPGYFEHAPERRNFHNYDALQTRIGLEVADDRIANPVAALVHLKEAGE